MKKFTLSELKHYTAATSLRRGRTLYEDDAVDDLEVSAAENAFGERLYCVSSWVTGSRGDFYRTRAWLTKEGEYYSSECTCPAFAKYDGLCKHLDAMFLQFFENEEFYMESAEGGPFSFEPIKRRTDSNFASLLNEYDRRERQSIGENAVVGQVHLEPTLKTDYRGVSVSLKIGLDRMYVVKDIAELVRNVTEQKEHSYGKNLSFLHRPEAFCESDRPLMEYFIRIYANKRYQYGADNRNYYLHDAQLDELLEITSQEGILMDAGNWTSKRWKMTDDILRQEVTLEAEEDGALLKCNPVRKMSTGHYNYYLKEPVIYREKRNGRKQAERLDEFLYRSSSEGTYIAAEDLPLFAREVLPVLRKYYDVRIRDIDLDQYLPEDAVFSIYLDLPQDNMITCDLIADYGGDQLFHVFEGIPNKGNRNVRQEIRAQQEVMKYTNAFDNARHLAVMADDEDGMYTLLTEGTAAFQKWAEVYVSDRLKRISEVRPFQVSVGVSLAGNLLDLEITSEEIPLDELAAILSKYSRKKRFIRLKDGSFLSAEDENLDTLSQLQKGLMLPQKELAAGHVEVPRYRALFLDAQLEENDALPVHKSRDFRKLIRDMYSASDSDYEVPDALDGILRGYQKDGYRWIETLYANGFGGILADDMGLGKTLQVITFLYERYTAQPQEALRTLIVCPASLVYNWEDEFGRFAPQLPVFVSAGAASERHALIRTLPERAIVITSYDLLKRDASYYKELKFVFQILDEAQFIKNSTTKAAHAVKAVRSDFRLALTGTPVENRLSELWSIFDYLMPGYLFSYQKFRAEIETPIVTGADKDAMRRLQKMIAPFVLRRLKKDVLKELPDKIERNMTARMEGEQKKLYDAHVQRLALFLEKQDQEAFDRSKIQILAELTKLRQLCCDPALMYEDYNGGSAKMDLCMELIANAIEGGHKILLFSQFTSMLSRIEEGLSAAGIRYYTLTGATPKQERIRLVNAFNQDEVPVFCISLKAGGTGLNLTAADIVIHFDPWWNTAAQNQATDRTHRIGQKNVVTVYRLIAKDSIEEKIVALQERKQQLADQVLAGSDASGASFSREELLELLNGYAG